MKKRIDSLGIFKFFGAYVIMLLHIAVDSDKLKVFGNGRFSNVIFDSGTLWVHFFLVVTGFLLAYNYKGKEIKSYRDFVVPKLIKIMPLFWISLIPYLIFPNTELNPFLLISNLFGMQGFFAPISTLLNGPAWYLTTYICIVLIFPFFKNLIDTKENLHS